MVARSYYLLKLIAGIVGIFMFLLVMGAQNAMAQREGDDAAEDKVEKTEPLRVIVRDVKEAEEADPGRQRHDGFFLRMAPGMSVIYMRGNGTREAYYDDPHLTSPGMLFDFAIGGAVKDNLILHAGFTSSSPILKMENMEDGIEGRADLTTVGAGLTYYFMPSNIYVSASAGMAHLEFRGDYDCEDDFDRDDDDCGDCDDDDDDLFHEHALGGSAQLMIGKEWFVSDNWGLGFGGSAKYAWAQSEHLNWDAGVFGLYFSATYN